MDKELVNVQFQKVLEAWPVYAAIASVLTVLVVFYFNGKVAEIADERIAVQVPTQVGYLSIKARVATLENDNGDVEDDVDRLEVQLTRVEGKIDDLLLIMQPRP